MSIRLRILFMVPAWLIACGGSSSDDSGNGSSGGSGGSAAGSGGAGTTGGSPAGGTSSVGGSGGSVQPGDCGPTVTFRMTPSTASDTEYCDGGSSACNIEWFWILDADGSNVATGLGCGIAPCSTCEAPGCPAICLTPSRVPEAGSEATWNGMRFVAGTCGPGAQCLAPTCAPAGEYVARFCAHALQGAGGSPSDLDCSSAASEPTCVDVPFSYPSTDVVEGVLE